MFTPVVMGRRPDNKIKIIFSLSLSHTHTHTVEMNITYRSRHCPDSWTVAVWAVAGEAEGGGADCSGYVAPPSSAGRGDCLSSLPVAHPTHPAPSPPSRNEVGGKPRAALHTALKSMIIESRGDNLPCQAQSEQGWQLGL